MAEVIHNCFIALAASPGDVSKRVVFSYMPEAGFSDTKSANYEDIEILGRQEPIRSYRSSSARQIGFSLDFFATDDVLNDVLYRVDWIRSLVYPDVAEAPNATGISNSPPVILLVVGHLFKMRAVVKNVNVTWKDPWGIRSETLAPYEDLPEVSKSNIAPMHATVELSVEELDNLLTGGGPLRSRPIHDFPPKVTPAPPRGNIPRKVAPVGGFPSFIPNPSEFVEKIGIPGFAVPHGNVGGPFGV